MIRNTGQMGARVGRIVRVVVSLLAASLALGALPASAQARFTSANQTVGLYRAFYYMLDDNNKPKLIHIEIVPADAKRDLNWLPKNFSVPKPPKKPIDTTATAVIGQDAVFAIYYGIDFAKPRPRVGRPLVGEDIREKALAIEWISEVDTGRTINCANEEGPDVCAFPKACHCGFSGGCCCY